jgi:2,4-dienoyl-CoA reductase-like NADH-dependent reductase (Old Yellow Enzyme family)
MTGTHHSKADPILRPLTIKSTIFRNRIFSSSHACGLQVDGFPQDAYQAYHEEKAHGGIGLSLFGGSSNVDIDSPNVFSQLNVGTDGIIEHLQRFSERMHSHGAALMCQITHLGRRGDPYAQDWLPTIAPSPLRETLHRAIPREMDTHDIRRVIKAYAAAAKRCNEGGLDGIETLASAHLIGQFMSPRTNQRHDRYGGSLANRMRFAFEVHEAIRSAVSDNFLVGMRLSVDEAISDGLTADECIEMALMLKREGHVDFFDALFGSMDTIRSLADETFPGIGTPLAPWVLAVGAFRREVGVPVLHAARISDLASARFALSEGHVDLVGMTRPHMADPQIVNKLMRGDEAHIRPCVGAQHCQSVHRPKCIHNAATGRETQFPQVINKAKTPRKSVVIGAGPAGLEAARVLAERGHDVMLFEAAAHPGGQLLLACEDPGRRDLIGIVSWRLSELQRLGVGAQCNRVVEAHDVLTLKPELVIIATGGVPQTDFGSGSDLCSSTWDILGRQTRATGEVIVFDGTGRQPGPAAAQQLHAAGADVQFVSIDNTLGQDLTYAEATRWRKAFAQRGIVPTYESRPTAVTRDGNRLKVTLVSDLTNTITQVVVDHLVVEMGTVPVNDLFEALKPHSGNDGVTDLHALAEQRPQPHDTSGFELHRIGDAWASRNIHAAIYDALRLGRVS